MHNKSSSGSQVHYWHRLLAIALIMTMATSTGAQDDASDSESGEEPALVKGLVRLLPESAVWVNPKQHYVVVGGSIVLREGPLEMFACLRNTKEHESIVAVDSKAYVVHTALLAAGAQAGRPVQFHPKYAAATGTVIKVEVAWQDPTGQSHRANARDWIRDFHTQQALEHEWVFGGSGFSIDPDSGDRKYYAEGGELICVANFATATMDLPIESTQSNDDRLYEAFTDRIPPAGTKVYLILTPQLAAKPAASPAPGGGHENEVSTEQANQNDLTTDSAEPEMMLNADDAIHFEPGETTANEVTVLTEDGQPKQLPYLLHVPPNYSDHTAPAAMILFLHGLGECGLGDDQLSRVSVHGPLKNLALIDEFQFVVAAPQSPPLGPKAAKHVVYTHWNVLQLNRLLDHLESNLNVDPKRIYLMGLSMGGFGTWRWAAADPERFAAVVPICGGGDPKSAKALAHVPIWAFHGAKDTVVPVERTRQMCEAIESAGGKPRLTIYPAAGHDSWTETFANPDVYRWLLSHKKE